MSEVWVVTLFNFNDDFPMHDGKVLVAAGTLYSAAEFIYTDSPNRYGAQGKRLNYDLDDDEWAIEIDSGATIYYINKVSLLGGQS